MAAVVLNDVRKRYGRTDVIHGISIHIADREFIVIVGPSGCGKSTLLRMVAGLERITGGTISIGGRVVNEVEPKDRDIAMVFQNYALYPHMSVRENMAYGLKIAGMPKADIASRIERTATMLQLSAYLDRKPRELSGGQRQRVAMGRALIREPAAFLLDEPLSNLDAKLRVQMRLEIRQMQRAVGVTSLYVTHDQVEAMTLADRLVVMNAGVAEQIDTPLEVYRRPATVFVAGFIGSPAMNLWSAALLQAAGATDLPGGPPAAAPTADRLLGVRPEHIIPVPVDRGGLAMTVQAIEILGADTLAHGRLMVIAPGGSPRQPRPDTDLPEVVVRLPGSSNVAIGEVFGLHIEPGSWHGFDAQTGRRLVLPK